MPLWKKELPHRYDFSHVPEGAIDEFHRQAELWLEGSIKLALAADSRATALTATLGAASAALIVLGSNLLVAKHFNRPLDISIFVVAAILFAAASFCAAAARPVKFYVSGFEPRLLVDSTVTDSEWDLKIVSAESIQQRIDMNAQSLRRAARTLGVGRFLAAIALPAGLLIYLFCSHPALIWAFRHA